MKKIFSKKSGFTLVEIIIAFAVFSVMAAMIVQVLNLTLNRKSENNKYEEWLSGQGKMLVTKKQMTQYDKGAVNPDTGKIEDGFISLAFTKDDVPLFTDDDDENVGWSIPYQMFSVGGDLTKDEVDEDGNKVQEHSGVHDASGLNYFVGDIEYAFGGIYSEGDDDEDKDKKDEADIGGSSQMSRFDTRLMGSKGITKVTVRYSYVGEHFDSNGIFDGYEYHFWVSVTDPNIDPKTSTHSQVTLVFGEGKSGGELATIKSVNNGSKDSTQLLTVKKSSPNSVNVHCPDDYTSVTSGFNGREQDFSVVFTSKINDLGFGDNGVGDLSSGCSYEIYKGYSNIFGAYEKAS